MKKSKVTCPSHICTIFVDLVSESVALVVIVYAVILFYRRLYLMTNAKPYGYSDMIGPPVFALFTITGV